MQQSDAMLLSSLKQYIIIPNQISTLKDILTKHIFLLACSVFEVLKIDYSQLKQINKAQRFRSLTKLTQIINQQMDTAFELSDVMNPTLPIIRKILLAFISKLGVMEGQKNKAIISQNNEGNQKQYKKQMLKRWINTEYICSQLRTQNKVKYQPYLLKYQLKKQLFKRNIVQQLLTVKGNSNSIIKTIITKQIIQKKKIQAEEGFTKKIAQQHDRNFQKTIKNNVDDWGKIDVSFKKIKKQYGNISQKHPSANIGKQNGQMTKQMSIFQQEVSKISEQQKKLKQMQDKKAQLKSLQISSQKQKQSKQKQLQQNLNPLQQIKQQCEQTKLSLQQTLQQLLQKLTEQKQKLLKKQKLKQQYQDTILLTQQKIKQQKQNRIILKKQVQKQKIILDTILGQVDIVKQVQKIQQDVKFIQNQANKQITQLQKNIQLTKKQGEQKLQILKNMKYKLHKIQTDYIKICQQIQDKIQIKDKIKINKSGLSRLYYNKKISQMEIRWRQTQKQSKKISTNVNTIKDQIKKILSFAQVSQNQIQSYSITNKLKNQQQHIIFKDNFLQCQKSFKQTMKCLEQLNQTRTQMQQYQMKVHALAAKDYKQGMKKIKTALQDLKKQLKQFNTKK